MTENFKKILFFSTVFLFILAVCLLNNEADRDLWHRLAVGKTFFDTGTLLKNDIFAYTPVKGLWVDHEWGSGVIFYYLTRFFGDYGLMALKIALLSLTIFFIYLTINLLNKGKNNFRIIYFILTVIAIYPGFMSTLRSQAFTYLFFALWVYLFEKIRRDGKVSLWIFPVTFVVWANLHGGFLAGVGLIGIYILGEFLNGKNYKKFLLILAVTLPFGLVNPWGIKFWEYLIPAVLMKRPYITEWEPFNFFDTVYNVTGFRILLFLTFFASLYKLLTAKIKIPDLTVVLLLLVTAVLSFRSERHVVFFAIASSIFIYKPLYEMFGKILEILKNNSKISLPAKYKRLLNFAREGFIYAFLAGALLNVIFSTPPVITLKQKHYPLESIEFIRINKLSGNLLVPFNWGSYALWKLYPQCLVSIDGRYEETYSDKVYKENMDFYYGKKDWKVILNKYKTDMILIEKDSKAFRNASSLKDFKLVFKDKTSALFVRKELDKDNYLIPSDNIDYAKEKYQTGI